MHLISGVKLSRQFLGHFGVCLGDTMTPTSAHGCGPPEAWARSTRSRQPSSPSVRAAWMRSAMNSTTYTTYRCRRLRMLSSRWGTGVPPGCRLAVVGAGTPGLKNDGIVKWSGGQSTVLATSAHFPGGLGNRNGKMALGLKKNSHYQTANRSMSKNPPQHGGGQIHETPY